MYLSNAHKRESRNTLWTSQTAEIAETIQQKPQERQARIIEHTENHSATDHGENQWTVEAPMPEMLKETVEAVTVRFEPVQQRAIQQLADASYVGWSNGNAGCDGSTSKMWKCFSHKTRTMWRSEWLASREILSKAGVPLSKSDFLKMFSSSVVPDVPTSVHVSSIRGHLRFIVPCCVRREMAQLQTKTLFSSAFDCD